MPKPVLFIGSSTEAMPIVKDIHTRLQRSVTIKTWYHNVFLPGEHPLESLRREVLRSDFALLVITPDDHLIKRDMPGFTPRDNVLFELGMFMSALGPRRSFYLVVTDRRDGAIREVNIPSDLAGITRLQITHTDDPAQFESDLGAECVHLENAISRAQNNLELNLLPSTSLAIGYFKNFVLPVCKAIVQTHDLKVGNDVIHDCRQNDFDFYIVLPDRGMESGHEGFESFTRTRNLQSIEIKGHDSPRRFPFFLDSELYRDSQTGKMRVKLYDCPTTLLAAREAIQLVSRGTPQDEIEAMEKREIDNFDKTLRRLLNDPSAAGFHRNIKLAYANTLPHSVG